MVLQFKTGSLGVKSLRTTFLLQVIGDYTVEVTDNNGCYDYFESDTFSQTNADPCYQKELCLVLDANSGCRSDTNHSSGIPPFEFVFAPAGFTSKLIQIDRIPTRKSL